LIPPLRRRFPHTKILALHCSRFYASPETRSAAGFNRDGVLEWFPGAGTAGEFLEREIPDMDPSQIRIIEWRPAFLSYGKICLDLLNTTAAFIKRIQANRQTVRGFGRRWLRNGLRNLEMIGRAVSARPGRRPAVVCASGPSLEDCFPLLRQWKALPSPPLLIAVSSAVPAMVSAGLSPDIAVSTDGGGWAALHLIELCRNWPAGRKPVLAAGLSAAIPSQFRDNPVLVLCDGSLWQLFLLQKLRIPFLNFPMRGTVSAAALDLAFYLSEGTVYLAGLDLGHRDLRTHAKPHAFDRLWEEKAGRFEPLLSQHFVRARNIENSGSHGVYAAWFREQLKRYPKRLYSLNPNPVLHIPALPPDHIPSQDAENLPVFSLTETRGGEAPGTGREFILNTLADALKEPALKPKIETELEELLFPERSAGGPAGKDNTADTLTDTLINELKKFA
jgi:hypothetical protein